MVLWDGGAPGRCARLRAQPALAANETLELWLIEDTPAAARSAQACWPPPAGARQRIAFKPARPVGAVAQFLISRERNDGNASPATPGATVLAGPRA